VITMNSWTTRMGEPLYAGEPGQLLTELQVFQFAPGRRDLRRRRGPV
jgi:hypothetical protein